MPHTSHSPFPTKMGIDLKHGGRAIGKKHRTEPKSKDVYLRLLYKVRQGAFFFQTPPFPKGRVQGSPRGLPPALPPLPCPLFPTPHPHSPPPLVIWFLGKAYGRGV
jgi:hypothetical protein